MKIERYKAKGGGWEWKVDTTIAGKRIRESGFTTKQALDDFILELKLQSKRRRHRLPIDQALVPLEKLVKSYVATLGDSKNDLRAGKILENFRGGFPTGTMVQDVTAADLREYIARLRKQSPKLKAESVNRYLADVCAMFRDADSLFRELEDQDWRPPKFPWQKIRRRGRERVVTLQERELILEALRFPGRQKYKGRREKPSTIATRRDVADAFEVGLNTAMRPGEVRKLTWSQIDFDSAEISLKAAETKTREPRVVPMNRRVLEILRRRRNSNDSNDNNDQIISRSRWVFPNQAGDGPRDEISKIIRPIAKKLGLEYGRELENGFTPHSQRHTATTEMFRRGVDMGTVKSITGHSDSAMALRYAHATHASRREAVEGLSEPVEGSTSTGSRQKVDKA